MKKTTLLAVIASLSISPVVYASGHQEAEFPSCSSQSPQVCQFSLSSYTGTIQNGNTYALTVGLSCPQQSDVYATVVVHIDGKLVASEVVKVPAGNTRSASFQINVGSPYNGKTYELGVQ